MPAVAELVEPRMLLSATTELEIVAETWSSGTPPVIDEIRLVGDEVQVFSTLETSNYFPGELQPAVDVASPIPASPVVAKKMKSEPVRVTVPDRELSVVYFFANLNQPQGDLYYLRTFGTSELLYRRPNADGNSAWPVTDIDPGAGSTVGLDFTAKPAAPQGLVAVIESDSSKPVSLYFDEDPSTAAAGPRSVSRYEVRIQSAQSGSVISQLTVLNDSNFKWTDSGGVSRTFGGSTTQPLTPDVYSFSVRVQQLPVFPDGATGDNALASPWSDWSQTSDFTVLPKGQQILVGAVTSDPATGIAAIGWGLVENAASYEVWVNQLPAGTKVLHRTGLSGREFRTDPLDSGNYRVWVRATRADGTKTTWSRSKDFTIDQPYIYFTSYGPLLGPNPAIQWNEIARSTRYTITFTDLSLAGQGPEINKWVKPAYTRTVSGSSSTHTIETPLAAGNYLVQLVLYYANGTTSQVSGNFAVEPSGVPIPTGFSDEVRWSPADNAASYDVWVAYLGAGPPRPDVTGQASNWNFALVEGVTSGSYRLPSNAPGGSYRIWLRPNVLSAGHWTRGAWNASTDVQIPDPIYRTLQVRIESETLTWDSIPGAIGYRVTAALVSPDAEWNYWFGNPANRKFDVTGTTFRLPDELNDGIYQVWVQILGRFNQVSQPGSVPIRVVHGTPWTWGLSNTPNAVQWNTVPNAVSYDVRLTEKRTGNVILSATSLPETSVSLPADLPPDHYHVEIRALRSVSGKQLLTEWAGIDFDHGVVVPGGFRMEGNILSWDAQEGARFPLSITVVDGYLKTNPDLNMRLVFEDPPEIRILPPYWWGPQSTIVVTAETNRIDLSQVLAAVYSWTPSATLRISLSAMIPNPSGGPDDSLLAGWTDPVDFKLPPRPELTIPVVERTARPAPPSPGLFINDQGSLAMTEDFNFLGEGAGAKIYRMENGTSVDLEYVERFQLRIRNTQTGDVTMLDESQLPGLMRVSEYYERPLVYPVYAYRDDFLLPRGFGIPVSLKEEAGFSDGVYEIQARVQYLPVIQTATSSDPYETLMGSPAPSPDHINVAATPWSEWSTPFEYTVLPDGQNILPLSMPAATVEQRPTFAWASNTSNAVYELWVQNRTTREVVVHETLTDVRRFRPATNLPAGQYDWWVRIVGTEGPHKGWSPKQSIEIVAPAIRMNVIAATVDATPVVSWTRANNAQSYLVTITSSTTGRVVYQSTGAGNQSSHAVTTPLPNDTYAVSIQAVFANGSRTAPGPVNAKGEFLPPRMIVGAAPKIISFSATNLSWNPVNGATKYQVWINYIDPAGRVERLIRQDVYAAKFSIPSGVTQQPGQYRVWVQAIRNEGGEEFIGRWSNPATISVGAGDQPIDASALLTVMSELATSGLPNA